MTGLPTARATAGAIEVEHLSKTYGSFTAIRDVSFQVNAGEIMGFLGPNGAGKTTSMRILAGYLPASEGTARVAGFDVHENSMAVRQRIGYLPENPPLYPDMTVEAYLHFVAQIKRVSAGDRPRRVDEAIRRCSLEEKRHTLIRKLSKGFKQRVGIAQALVHDPPVIILDEPTIGLDPKQIIEVRKLIKSLAGEHTIILSTHILPEVSTTCDRVVIINRGQVAAIGTPAELTAQLQDRQQAKLVVGATEAMAIRTALQPLPQVEVVSLQPLAADPSRWQVQLKSNAAADGWIPEVARVLVQAGIDLYEIGRPQASLEEIFLQHTNQPISTLYDYQMDGQQVVTVYVRDLPIVSFVEHPGLEPPLMRASALVAQLNQMAQGSLKDTTITLGWAGLELAEQGLGVPLYTIQVNNKELLRIDDGVLLIDNQRPVDVAVLAANRLRRLLLDAPPISAPALPQPAALTAKAAVAGPKSKTAPQQEPTPVRVVGPVQEGIASWYDLHPTRHEMTAAHPTLPFGTEVRVTNLKNGRQAVVRINDRGPFIPGRIIDLSLRAAEVLGMVRSGLAPVRVEVLQR